MERKKINKKINVLIPLKVINLMDLKPKKSLTKLFLKKIILPKLK